MSDKTEDKANRYLTDGKVRVTALGKSTALVEVQGSGSEPYTCDYSGSHWSCDCPAYTECAHIVAAKRITPFRDTVAKPMIGTPSDDVTAFLNQYLNK